MQQLHPQFNVNFYNWAVRNEIRFDPADLNEQFKKVKEVKRSLNDVVDEALSKKPEKGKKIELVQSNFYSSIHIPTTVFYSINS